MVSVVRLPRAPRGADSHVLNAQREENDGHDGVNIGAYDIRNVIGVGAPYLVIGGTWNKGHF